MESNKKVSMQLQCPLPKLYFDKITLGHGSGGLLTHKLLNETVLALLKNPLLNQQQDGAILEMKGKLAFSTDSFLVSPIIFPGGNIGDLAVNGTVNDLAMCGAIPKYLSLSLIIEEGLEMEVFWEVLNAIKIAADEANVVIVTGDTKVVERGKGDHLFINTSGIGEMHSKANLGVDKIKMDDVIIVSGEIAAHGMAIMSVRNGLEFESEIKTDSAPLQEMTLALLNEFGEDIHFFTDPTRGGVATVLSELVIKQDFGIEIDHSRIPINQQVEAACEILGLDPLFVANEGLFVTCVAKEMAPKVLERIQAFPNGKNAAIIGHVVNENIQKVIMKSSIGGRRVITMLPGEQLPRIC